MKGGAKYTGGRRLGREVAVETRRSGNAGRSRCEVEQGVAVAYRRRYRPVGTRAWSSANQLRLVRGSRLCLTARVPRHNWNRIPGTATMRGFARGWTTL